MFICTIISTISRLLGNGKNLIIFEKFAYNRNFSFGEDESSIFKNTSEAYQTPRRTARTRVTRSSPKKEAKLSLFLRNCEIYDHFSMFFFATLRHILATFWSQSTWTVAWFLKLSQKPTRLEEQLWRPEHINFSKELPKFLLFLFHFVV